MRGGNLIQIAADQWVVMRENPTHPKAVIQGIVNASGEVRYMVMVWRPNPLDRRMVGIYESLPEAERSVPWARKPPSAPSAKAGGETPRAKLGWTGYVEGTPAHEQIVREMAERRAAQALPDPQRSS